MVAGDRQHVGDAPFLEEVAQRPVVAVGLIGRDPAERDPGRDCPLDHQLQELRLRPERRPLRDPRGRSRASSPGPGPRQVKLPVDQRAALRAGIGEEDPELAVRDLPGRARVLPLHPCQSRQPPLLESGVVADQDPVRVAERGGDIAAHIVADQSASHRAVVNKPLHPVRVASPACSASDQPVFRSRPDSIPARHARARTRTSRRKNRPATSANASSSPDSSRDA